MKSKILSVPLLQFPSHQTFASIFDHFYPKKVGIKASACILEFEELSGAVHLFIEKVKSGEYAELKGQVFQIICQQTEEELKKCFQDCTFIYSSKDEAIASNNNDQNDFKQEGQILFLSQNKQEKEKQESNNLADIDHSITDSKCEMTVHLTDFDIQSPFSQQDKKEQYGVMLRQTSGKKVENQCVVQKTKILQFTTELASSSPEESQVYQVGSEIQIKTQFKDVIAPELSNSVLPPAEQILNKGDTSRKANKKQITKFSLIVLTIWVVWLMI